MATATLPTQMAPANADAELEAAWQRLVTAREAFDVSDPDYNDEKERLYWTQVDEAESFIQSATAQTPAGVAVQLWVALDHCIAGREQFAAIHRRDLAAFASTESEIDWNGRVILAALRSLESMGGTEQC